jgi:hypothetical protein
MELFAPFGFPEKTRQFARPSPIAGWLPFSRVFSRPVDVLDEAVGVSAGSVSGDDDRIAFSARRVLNGVPLVGAVLIERVAGPASPLVLEVVLIYAEVLGEELECSGLIHTFRLGPGGEARPVDVLDDEVDVSAGSPDL